MFVYFILRLTTFQMFIYFSPCLFTFYHVCLLYTMFIYFSPCVSTFHHVYLLFTMSVYFILCLSTFHLLLSTFHHVYLLFTMFIYFSLSHRLPTDFSQVIYAVGVREGSVEEWDHVWIKSQETQSPSEREMLLEALAHSQKPWLLWRYCIHTLIRHLWIHYTDG